LLAAENDAESQAVFDHHISATFESIKRMVSNEVAIPKPESLLPVIRANILPVQQKTDDSLFRTEFAADMWTYLVIDGGRTIAYLLESQLAEMEMDQADVLDVAISNLEDTGWSPLFTPVSSSFASIFYLGEGNMFDSSLLLMNATKTELAKRFRRPVALLLAREIVLVADGSSPEDIETLQRVAQERLKKGSWEEFHEDQ
jgi:uncharacterized protein YtpQ (UPF0354 family)